MLTRQMLSIVLFFYFYYYPHFSGISSCVRTVFTVIASTFGTALLFALGQALILCLYPDINSQQCIFQKLTAALFQLSTVEAFDVRYSNGGLNTRLNIVRHSNTGPFRDQTTSDHLNTRLVRYLDPHSNR